MTLSNQMTWAGHDRLGWLQGKRRCDGSVNGRALWPSCKTKVAWVVCGWLSLTARTRKSSFLHKNKNKNKRRHGRGMEGRTRDYLTVGCLPLPSDFHTCIVP